MMSVHVLVVEEGPCRDLIESLMGTGCRATHVDGYEGSIPPREELVAAFFNDGPSDPQNLTFPRIAWTQLTSEILSTVDVVLVKGDRLLGWHPRGETVDVTGVELALELRRQHGYTGRIFFYSTDPAIARRMMDEVDASYLETAIAQHAFAPYFPLGVATTL